ncbi:MAG: DUF6351 family protein [Aquihabitans sp.]
MRRRRHRSAAWLAVLLATALTGAACSSNDDSAIPSSTTTDRTAGGPSSTIAPNSGAGDEPVQDVIRIEVLSSQPDRISGPEARIRVVPASNGSLQDLKVTLDDHDVTGQFVASDGGLEGVVGGLVEGTNTLIASGGGESVTQRLRSWPLTGPMISGPQIPLLACSTEEHGLGGGDKQCSAATRVTWSYLSADDQVHDLADPTGPLPADVATASVAGKSHVPLVIRHEVGVVNRSIYEIATIDPSPGGDDSDQSDAAWNQRLLYRFGDGCGATHGQGSSSAPALSPTYLKAGYAVATASFTTGAVQCNDVVSAETVMMVKERFIEVFGVPEVTVGEGRGFGGAQVLLLTQNYPGLVDAAAVSDAFPDIVTTLNGAADCGLLDDFYATAGGTRFTDEQRVAVNGHASAATCENWVAGYGSLVDPSTGCDPKIPAEEIYAADTNPGGVRCTVEDLNIAQFGRDEDSPSRALRLLDNVGLQYGLKALNAGDISFDQFIDLNAHIGGYDDDGIVQAARHEADDVAVQTAYESGRVSAGTGDQKKVPIIAVDHYDDDEGAIGSHHHLLAQRYRLTFGDHPDVAPGFQIWTRSDLSSRDADDARFDAVTNVDQWASDLADSMGVNRRDALIEHRPTTAIDRCTDPKSPTGPSNGPTTDSVPGTTTVPSTDLSDDLSGSDVYEPLAGACEEAYPASGDPRIAAGSPETGSVLKCTLKPIDPTDYEVRITDDDYERLLETFPSGVCDWSSAGVGQTIPSMADRSYEDVESPADKA